MSKSIDALIGAACEQTAIRILEGIRKAALDTESGHQVIDQIFYPAIASYIPKDAAAALEHSKRLAALEEKKHCANIARDRWKVWNEGDSTPPSEADVKACADIEAAIMEPATGALPQMSDDPKRIQNLLADLEMDNQARLQIEDFSICFGPEKARTCYDAFNGSIAAAFAFHEAELPDWGVEIAISGGYASALVFPDAHREDYGDEDWVTTQDKAQSLFLADVKALAHQAEADAL